MSGECIFCKIVKGEIPSEKVYEDEEVFAFKDINPLVPVHLLIIPKKHIADLNGAASEDAAVLGKLQLVAAKLAAENGIDKSGYRTVFNNGSDAGQLVFHLHLHLLGGQTMGLFI